MNKLTLTRHQIREKALQSLFPLEMNKDLMTEKAIYYAIELDNPKLNEEIEISVPTYLELLVKGVSEKKIELDEMIKKHLGNQWSLNRIAKMDLIVLRMAIYEMLYVEDVPNPVALDEAIELAKKYSDDCSRKFVNGVLSNVMKEMPPN